MLQHTATMTVHRYSQYVYTAKTSTHTSFELKSLVWQHKGPQSHTDNHGATTHTTTTQKRSDLEWEACAISNKSLSKTTNSAI